MNDRQEIRLTLRAINNGWDVDPIIKQSLIRTVARYLPKLQASNLDDPTAAMTQRDEANLKLTIAIMNAITRVSGQHLAGVKAEIAADLQGFNDLRIEQDGTPTAVAEDAAAARDFERMLVEQLECCESVEEVKMLRNIYERTRARTNSLGGGGRTELRVLSKPEGTES